MRRCAILAALVAGAAGPACSLQKSVYWPNVVNAPALAERGDKHLSGHGTFIDYQANGAYAVTDHVAVRAQADVHPGVAWSGDLGIGLFGATRRADGTVADEGVRWELAADLGRGATNAFTANTSMNFDEDDDLESTTWKKVLYDTRYNRASVQGSVALVQPHYELIVVLRGTAIQGTVDETAFKKVTGNDLEKHRTSTGIDWLAIEPAGIVRWDAFHDHGFIEVQLGASNKSGDKVEDFANNGLLYPILATVGLGTEF